MDDRCRFAPMKILLFALVLLGALLSLHTEDITKTPADIPIEAGLAVEIAIKFVGATNAEKWSEAASLCEYPFYFEVGMFNNMDDLEKNLGKVFAETKIDINTHRSRAWGVKAIRKILGEKDAASIQDRDMIIQLRGKINHPSGKSERWQRLFVVYKLKENRLIRAILAVPKEINDAPFIGRAEELE